jgi:hypothetical protein
MRIFYSFLAGFLSLVFVQSVWADDLAHPKGPIILEVHGELKSYNKGKSAVFDRAMLTELGMQTITTSTPWHKSVISFEGPSGKSLLEKLGVTKGMMTISALNNYSAKVPVSDFFETGAILAIKADGDNLSVRNKGPVFIIYPYDQNPKLANDKYYVRSVWQVKAINIENE